MGTVGSCTNAAVVTVSVVVTPTITSFNSISATCGLTNGTATIIASPGSSYTWSSGQTTNTVGTLAPGNYTVNISIGACTTQTIVSVGATAAPVILSTFINGTTCGLANGSATVITTPSNNTYLWSSPTGLNNASTLLSAGIYTVTAINGACRTSTTITVASSTSPVITSSVIVPSGCDGFDGEFIIKEVTSGLNPYSINFNNSGNSFESKYSGLSSGSYSLQITDANNCKNDFTVFIPDNGDGTLYIPNTFTPNGDKVNDIWNAVATCVKSYNCIIYSRWGNKIVELTDINIGWDGTYKNGPVADGVYVYILELETYNKTTIKKSGHISLFR